MEPSTSNPSRVPTWQPFARAIWTPQLSPQLLHFVAVAFFIAVLGNSWPAFQGKGTPLGRYLESIELAKASAVTETTTRTPSLHEATFTAPSAAASSAPQSAPIARTFDRLLAGICLILTAVLTFSIRTKPELARLYLIPAIWIFMHSLAASLHGAKIHAELSLPAHATRYLLPVVLALLVWRPHTSKPIANGLLRVATASTFAIHGIEALQLAPSFQKLLSNFGALFGSTIPSHVIDHHLHAIGIMDLLLATSVLLIHNPALLRWMAFWGIITALARPVTMGWDAWPEVAIRLANGLCPWLIIALSLPALIPSTRPNPSAKPT